MADRELVIRLKYDATEATAAAEAFWRAEQQRMATAGQAAQAHAQAQGRAYQQAAQVQAQASGAVMGNSGPALRPTGAPDVALAQAAAARAQTSRAGIIAAGSAPGAAPNLQAAAAAAKANAAAAQAQAQSAQVLAGTQGQLAGQGGAMNAVSGGLSSWPAPPAPSGRGALAVTAVAAGSVSGGMQSAAQSQAAANEHIADITAQMETARASQREIAALRGEAPTGATAAAMAREAAGAGISPEQYQQFQVATQAYAGQFAGTKIPTDQFGRLQQQVASYAVGAKGLAPQESARLLGTLMDKARPGATDKDIMDQYAKSMSVMQLAPGYTGPLLGQLSEVAGEAVGPNGDMSNVTDASILLRGVAQRNPAQASAYTRALLRGLREARMSPKESAALGIKPGMDTFQQLEAIQSAADKATAGGQDEGEFLTKHGFGEIRQYGGLRTALDSGLRGGGFRRARDEAARVDAGTAAADAQAYLSGQEGSAQSQRGMAEAARLERANRYVALNRFKRDAEIAAESSGEFERGEGLGSIFTLGGQAFGQGDRREQVIRMEAARNIRMGLTARADAGNREADEFLRAPMFEGSSMSRAAGLNMGRAASDDFLATCANELVKLRQLAEEDRKRRDADARSAPPAAGVSVRQPVPRGRMDVDLDPRISGW